jgi:hypothetical protein
MSPRRQDFYTIHQRFILNEVIFAMNGIAFIVYNKQMTLAKL